MSDTVVTKAAIGRVAGLGDLYDIRKDDFCGISIFKKDIPESALSTPDAHFSDIQLVHSDDFSEKFSKLNITAELKISVLAGLFSLEGSARFLNDQKKSARTVKSSLIYNIRTKQENLNVYHEDLRDAFSIDAIESGVATHVVTGISWGANSVLSSLYENKEARDVKEIAGSLKAHMNKASLAISGGASVDFNEGDNNSGVKFEVRVYGDILPQNHELPTTFEGALALMKQMPKLVANSNDGKGKPLVYRLMPISLLKDYLDFAIKADLVLQTIEEASVMRVVSLFEQMAKAQQQLHDFHQDALEWNDCVSNEDLSTISALKEEVAIGEASLKAKLGSVLTQVRSGECDVSDVEALIEEFHNSDVSPNKVLNFLATNRDLIAKINQVRTFVQNGAKYIGIGSVFDDEILQDFDSKVWVFFLTQNGPSDDPVRWRGNRQIFYQQLKKKADNNKFYVVDCDTHPHLMPVTDPQISSCVQTHEMGRILSEDHFADSEGIVSIPFAQSTVGAQRVIKKPETLVPFSIPCTGNNCDPAETYAWVCKKCYADLKYGFDQLVYCKCGKTPAAFLEFKCPDPNHGFGFEAQDEAYLSELLETIRRPLTAMNILLIGEPGANNSAWVNGFVNYLKHSSLEKAEGGKLRPLMSTEFGVTNEDGDEVTVTIEGDSVLQNSNEFVKIHPIQVGDLTVRLIYTGGIWDMTGLAMGKRCLDRLFSPSCPKSIHGICVLLDPENVGMSLPFQFLIKEMFTCFTKQAKTNIAFCFTNKADTSDEDLVSPLKLLLSESAQESVKISEKTLYSIDASAYRHLAAVKSGLLGAIPDPDAATESWAESSLEASRLLNYFRSRDPFKSETGRKLTKARLCMAALHQFTILVKEEYGDQIDAEVEDDDSPISKWQRYLKQIRAVQPKLAQFLQHHAISPVNDIMITYLEHVIGQLPEDSGDLERFESAKFYYQVENMALESFLEEEFEEEPLTLEEFDELIANLKTMPVIGKLVQQIFTAVNID